MPIGTNILLDPLMSHTSRHIRASHPTARLAFAACAAVFGLLAGASIGDSQAKEAEFTKTLTVVVREIERFPSPSIDWLADFPPTDSVEIQTGGHAPVSDDGAYRVVPERIKPYIVFRVISRLPLELPTPGFGMIGLLAGLCGMSAGLSLAACTLGDDDPCRVDLVDTVHFHAAQYIVHETPDYPELFGASITVAEEDPDSETGGSITMTWYEGGLEHSVTCGLPLTRLRCQARIRRMCRHLRVPGRRAAIGSP